MGVSYKLTPIDFIVMIKDLPGCISQGDSLEEAIQNIQEAKAGWVETALQCNDDIPLPSTL